MNDYSQQYGDTSSRDRQRPNPGDPESAFYGAAGQRPGWVDADGDADARGGYARGGYARGGYMPYGYSRYTRTVPHRHNGWVKWLLIGLAILFAIPLLKVLLAVILVASVTLALLFGFVVFLALMALSVALLFGAGRMMFGRRPMRL